MDLESLLASDYYKYVVLITVQSLLVIMISKAYSNRITILEELKSRLNTYVVSCCISVVILVYQSQILELLKSPPSWIFLVPLILYYLTILSSTYKERVDQFKDKVKDVEQVASEQKTSIATLTNLSDTFATKFKALSIKLQGVNKVSQTLQETARELQLKVGALETNYEPLREDFERLNKCVEDLSGYVTGFSLELQGLVGNFDSVQGKVSGIQGDVSGIQGDVSGIQGDVSGIQGDVSMLNGKLDNMLTLIQQIANR